jgi:hypothetical protein
MNLAIPRRAVLVAATIPVAGVAAAASYHHIHTLAAAHGQPEFIAATLPLSVDGMILIGSLAATDGRTHRGTAWSTFMVGVLFSLAANILVAEPDLLSRIISAFPSVSLLLTVEVLIRSNRVRAADLAASAVRLAANEGTMPDLVAKLEADMPVETHALAALLGATDTDAVIPEGMFWIAIADADLEYAEEDAGEPAPHERGPRLSAEELRAMVRALLKEDPHMTDEVIAERINREPRTATRYRREVQAETTAPTADEAGASEPVPAGASA